MDHKKIIALSAAISMLIFGGCSNSDKAAENTDAADSYSVSETTEIIDTTEISETTTVSSETEAETESITETTTSDSDSITAAEAYSEKNGASWTDALMKSTSNWDKGNIVFKCNVTEDGSSITSIEMHVYDNNLYMDTQIPGIMSMTLIVNGEKGYFIDKNSKTYSFDTETSYDADNEVESVVDTTADYSSFTEDGIENIEGTDYIFEKYSKDGSEQVFYYSPDGKLQKFGSNGEIADLTIDLLDEPDESYFEIPEDYTEISMEEMTLKMMSGVFSAIDETSEKE